MNWSYSAVQNAGYMAGFLDFSQTHYLWVAVVIPGIAATAILWRQRRAAFDGSVLIAVLAGMAISLSTHVWDHAGLRLLPIGMVLLAALSAGEFAQPALRRALRRGLLMAAWTWVSTLVVDVAGCLRHPDCRLEGTGGDGALDALVMLPLSAVLLAFLAWLVVGLPKRSGGEGA